MSESDKIPSPTPERPDSVDVPEDRDVSRKMKTEVIRVKDIRRTNKRVHASNKEQKPKSIFQQKLKEDREQKRLRKQERQEKKHKRRPFLEERELVSIDLDS